MHGLPDLINSPAQGINLRYMEVYSNGHSDRSSAAQRNIV